jgi:hypothetical protein
MPYPEILAWSEQMDKEARAVKKDVLKMCWYMRGLSYAEGMTLSAEERSIVSEIIKENLETTKKTNLPFF